MKESGHRRKRLSHLAAVLLIAAPILVLFGPVLVADRSLAMRDAGHFYHPLLKWTSREWLRDGPPLWNPYENTGMPLLADASSSLFYPGRLLLLAPIDFTWRYKLYVIGHVVLAALGSYLLARQWQASRPAAAAAAIAYSCGGSVVFQHSNVVFLVGAAWLPFAAWASGVMIDRRSWKAALALGIVLALMVLGGDPQMAYHAVLMAALYAVLAYKPEAQAKESSLTSIALRVAGGLGLVGLAAAFGLVLSAVQILPSLQAAAASERAYYERPRTVYEAAGEIAGSFQDGDERWSAAARGLLGQPEPTTHHDRLYDFSIAPWRVVEFVWPNIGGRMFPTHRRWMSLVPAEGRIWTPALYMGLVPLLLALWQWRIRNAEPAQAWLSWLLLVFTLGSFGWYGLGWCAREVYGSLLGGNPDRVAMGSPVGGLYWLMVTVLPGYVSFRYPAKLLVVAALAASQLAARGFDRALTGQTLRLPTAIKGVAVTSVVLLGACWLGFSWLNQLDGSSTLGRRIGEFLSGQRDPSLGPFNWQGCQQDVNGSLIQVIAVCLGAHCLLRLARASQRPVWGWSLAALVAADLAIANFWLIPTAPADTWRSNSAAAAAVHADRAPDLVGDDAPRVYRASLMRWRPASFSRAGDKHRLAQIAAWERDTLFPKYGLNQGISLVESYGSLKSVDYESLLYVARQHGPLMPGSDVHELPHPAVLQLLGTQYLVAPDHWRPNSPAQPPFAEVMPVPGESSLPKGAALWRMTEPLPRAWIVHQVEVLPPLKERRLGAVDERTREVLFPRSPPGRERSPRDFRTSAVVEADQALTLPQSEGMVGAEECHITAYELDRVEIEATLAVPGLVVLSDLHAPGWSATAENDGQQRSVEILRTNRVCRGVLLPAGRHRIVMVYRPTRFYAGAWISVIGWAVVIAVLAAFLRRPNKPTLGAGQERR